MLSIEFRKLKSTGFLPSIVIGGILAALIPILNTAARPDTFTSQTGPVLSILLTANAQMILLLHLILVICGACTMFHTEYAGRALNHMLALPLRPEGLYFKKAVILILCFLLLLTVAPYIRSCRTEFLCLPLVWAFGRLFPGAYPVPWKHCTFKPAHDPFHAADRFA